MRLTRSWEDQIQGWSSIFILSVWIFPTYIIYLVLWLPKKSESAHKIHMKSFQVRGRCLILDFMGKQAGQLWSPLSFLPFSLSSLFFLSSVSLSSLSLSVCLPILVLFSLWKMFWPWKYILDFLKKEYNWENITNTYKCLPELNQKYITFTKHVSFKII